MSVVEVIRDMDAEVSAREAYYQAYRRLSTWAMQDMADGWDKWAELEFRYADAAFAEYRVACRLAGVEARRA